MCKGLCDLLALEDHIIYHYDMMNAATDDATIVAHATKAEALIVELVEKRWHDKMDNSVEYHGVQFSGNM